ncbi:MAG: FAD-binding oxidoreductase, partial [Acidimicrobiia bacterium]|nr:FAD-binding oxidoreductase [Acidimicrobiia bacterium]
MLEGEVLTSDASANVDRPALEAALRKAVGGEVRFDAGSRSVYAVAGSNYRQVPIGLVIPKSIDDVVAAVAVSREHGAPVLPVGGMTSLAGQNVNVAVTIDFSKYLGNIDDLDPEKRVARVQPGLVLDVLRDRAEEHHLTFGPDPSTHTHCTFDGMIGNNSCGVHSVM